MVEWGLDDFNNWIDQGCDVNENVTTIKISSSEDKLDIYKIPDKISNLMGLREIDIGYTKISTIPESLCELTNLQTLSLFYNYISMIPESISKLTHLQKLYLAFNNISVIPEFISNLTNLKYLFLGVSKISVIPQSLCELTNLEYLWLGNNDISVIPDSISNLTNLECLCLHSNNISIIPDSISNLTNLEILNVSNNNISIIPESLFTLPNLHELYLHGNNISIIPYPIIHLRNLTKFFYVGNPVENIHPSVTRFLNRMKNGENDIYNDSQSVHKHSIQESVKQSISNIISQKYDVELDVIPLILNDEILDRNTKESLINYSNDESVHSILLVTFLDVLRAVWSRIILNENRDVIKSILCTEMMDSLCMCFTGRLSRLVNCLSSFDDLVSIKISENEQIGNIIAIARDKLKNEGMYDLQTHISLIRSSLQELGYSEDIIEEWIGYID